MQIVGFLMRRLIFLLFIYLLDSVFLSFSPNLTMFFIAVLLIFQSFFSVDLIIFLTCCEIMNSSEMFPDQKEMAELLISFEKFYFELAC